MKGLCYVGIERTASGWQRFAACHLENGNWGVIVRYGPLEQLDDIQAKAAITDLMAKARLDDLIEDSRFFASRLSYIKEACKQGPRQALDMCKELDPGEYVVERPEEATTSA